MHLNHIEHIQEQNTWYLFILLY